MKVFIQRGSVSMSDDCFAPHQKEFEIDDDTPIEGIVKKLVCFGYLPRILGCRATWSVFSNVPIAIVAQQWKEPKMFSLLSTDELDYRDGNLWLYVNYHAQIDPKKVYKIFWGLQLRAY